MIRLLLALFLMTAPAGAAEMSFYIDNQQNYDVAVELYGERPGRVWPGNDKVYLIEKGYRKSVPVTCDAGERICYGAWRVGNDRVFFGSGPDNAYRCTDCCFICLQSDTATIRLVR